MKESSLIVCIIFGIIVYATAVLAVQLPQVFSPLTATIAGKLI